MSRKSHSKPSRSAVFAIGLMFCACSVATSSLAAGKSSKLRTGSTSTSSTSTQATQTGPSLYYVSTLGNDAWSGKLPAPNSTGTDGPFATLGKARDTIRALHPSGSALAYPATVYVRGGTYQLTQPLVFAPQDSGTSSAPVTFAAYTGEEPVISGGMTISGWKPYSGTALPKTVASQVWVAQVPSGTSFHQIFVNGYRRTRARTPNAGAYHYVNGMTTAAPNPLQFYYNAGDIQSTWATAGNVDIVNLQKWGDIRRSISKVDSASQSVALNGSGPGSWTLEQNPRYWVENTLDALDAPGEWYLDQGSSLLYYYPLSGESISTFTAVGSSLQQLVQFQGNASQAQFVSYINFVSLSFQYSDWSSPANRNIALGDVDLPAGISGTGVRFSTIRDCRFTHLGMYALAFNQGSQGVTIVGNDFGDLGAGGIKIGDQQVPTSDALQTGSNQVTDNTIHDVGEVFPAGFAIWVGQSANNSVLHNEVFNTYYSAIAVGWTFGFDTTAAANNLIESNDIHDIGRGMLSDMGCVYTLGVQPGTVVNNNLCHDVSRSTYGGWGIYMDEGSSNILVTNNVVYGTQDGGFVSHRSQFVTVQNNVFALGQYGQLWRDANGATGQSFTFSRNIVYWTEGEFLNGWPPIWNLWSDGNYSFDYNLYYATGTWPNLGSPSFASWFPQWQSFGQDLHSMVADPQFVDPLHGNFDLRSGSPASQIGFHPIDLSTVGPRPGF